MLDYRGLTILAFLVLICLVNAQGECVVTSFPQLKNASKCTQLTIRSVQVPKDESIDLKLASGSVVCFKSSLHEVF
jgi:hypothetical protein